jgi:hypothetical protein
MARSAVLASLVWLLSPAACGARASVDPGPAPFPAHAPARQPPPSAPLAPSTEIPDGLAQLLLDGPVTGCQRFSIVAGDRSGSRWLVLRVDADRLKLKPGTHELAIDGRFVALEFSVFAAPTPPVVCSDERPRPVERRQRWRAVSGTVKVTWPKAERGAPRPIDVELVDVELVEDQGGKQRIATTMRGVEVGSTPG